MVARLSLFGQALKEIDRSRFAESVRRHKAEKWTKGFGCWKQFVSMLFCQLGSCDSLREICSGLSSAMGKVNHMGIGEAPKRATLAYANKHRPWEIYQDVFMALLEKARDEAGTRHVRFRFRNPLMAFDSTTIDLCLQMYDWAKFRKTKGGIKVHTCLDLRGCLPSWALVTEARMHDVRAARVAAFEPGTIVAMDRGYNDYGLFSRWTEEGVFFVTRMKDNARFSVVESRGVPDRGNVLSDDIVRLDGQGAADRCPHLLRRVRVWDADKGREIVFLTNNMRLAASTVAAIYRERWQIELFFKALKQNLKVRTFVGTGGNAVRTQIWTALIAVLLLKLFKLRSTFQWSFSNLASLFRLNLLVYRDLQTWLSNPSDPPEDPPPYIQPLLAL